MKKTSLYLEPELDAALAKRAADEGLTKAELIRRFLADGVSTALPPRLSVAVASGARRSHEHPDDEMELMDSGFGEIDPLRPDHRE